MDLALDTGRVIDMPPDWAFTIDCEHHGRIEFDFNRYREQGREELAGHMRDAVWSLRHELIGKTLVGHENTGLRTFWRFLDDLAGAGEAITHLKQIDRKLLDRYLAWLELQVVSWGKNKGQRLSVTSRKKSFDHLKTLLTNRQKRVPAAVSPALAFPRNPFPNSNQLTPKREPYSATEQERLVAALNQDLRRIHEGEGEPLTPSQVLVVHLLALALATGRNLQSLLDLRRDSLREHPLKDRELLVTTKRRGWSTHATAVRTSAPAPEDVETVQSVPTSIGDHFRFLADVTAPLMAEAAERDREFAFLWRVTKKKRKGQVVRLVQQDANNAIIAFIKRHALLDDRGRPLALNVARLRPTYGTELYRRTRDIRRVQQALGHSTPETTARHYVNAPLEAERDHAIVVEGMVSQFARLEVEGKTLLAADGKIPLQDVKDLLSGGYNTGIARCKNPFRQNESVCQKFFHCFKCPSMCVFEDDLWRLFSFYYRLLAERSKINAAHWLKTYGPIIRRIDVDIAAQFPAEKVEESRLKAQHTPHPTWKGPLL
ncbi:MAG TPA: tyrosine-type recombinase/integrase [Noviherbaspirillum sp.]|nr:tyrosine-type recombinase/integrase [Noviherbaspirillum sp.]